jgi:hypothetical protein
MDEAILGVNLAPAAFRAASGRRWRQQQRARYLRKRLKLR